jgi:hypothetical protein
MEENQMNLKKHIKKIISVAIGTAMVGATIGGAFAAADLSTYPKPFVNNGVFDGMIVVGDSAAPSDIVGAIDVAASLQYAMKTTKQTLITTGSGSTKIEGGRKIESSGTKLRYGDIISNVTATILPEDMPSVLTKEGTLMGDDDKDYTYKTSIKTPNTKVQFGEPGDLNSPIIYLDTNSNVFWTDVIEFPKSVNPSVLVNEKISLFGKDYTFSGQPNELTNESITLYGGALDQTFTAGNAVTINVLGKDTAVEVVGVNTDSNTATIKVNGESKTVVAGKTYSIGGVSVYVRDVFAYTAPVTSGAVRLFIGSDKLVLEDGSPIQVGKSGINIDGTNVRFSNNANQPVSRINIDVFPYDFEESVEYISFGEKGIVDPIFGTFKLALLSSTPGNMTTKDIIKVDAQKDKVRLSFTNKNDIKYSTDVFISDMSKPKFANDDSKKIITTNGASVFKNDYVILSREGYSHIVQLTKVSNDNPYEITLKDSGDTQTFSYDSTSKNGVITYDGYDYPFKVIATGTNAEIQVNAGVTDKIVTHDGAEMQFVGQGRYNATNGKYIDGTLTSDLTKPVVITPAVPAVVVNGTIVTPAIPAVMGTVTTTFRVNQSAILFNEASRYNEETDANEVKYAKTYSIQIGYDTSDKKMTATVDIPSQNIEDGDNYVALTPYGTYFSFNTNNNDKVDVEYYKEATTYDIYVAPISSAITTTAPESQTITSEKTEKITVGMAKLASEVGSALNQNMIVVGGPCVNSVAAALMGNPANCAAGFTEGKAMIKLFEQTNGKVAMMVAGYSAMDSRRATKVLSQYENYKGMIGKEVEISGTTLNDITISSPTPITTTTVAPTTTTVAAVTTTTVV